MMISAVMSIKQYLAGDKPLGLDKNIFTLGHASRAFVRVQYVPHVVHASAISRIYLGFWSTWR